ncbi:MAG: hypothetical protein ABIR67_10270 [Gaiellaceae bacterium]
MSFDLLEHHRRRTRTAEGRADGLARELAKADRLLALALRVAARNECDPLVLLCVLERADEIARSAVPTTVVLVTLLRETDPARILEQVIA